MSTSASSDSEGWVKGVDPSSGRTFYANHLTRRTQWDPPAGWSESGATAGGGRGAVTAPDYGSRNVDLDGAGFGGSTGGGGGGRARQQPTRERSRIEPSDAAARRGYSSGRSSSSSSGGFGRSASGGGGDRGGNEDASGGEDGTLPPLPSNWEMMRDKATGRAFYVDHSTKVTTWERPVLEAAPVRGGEEAEEVNRGRAPEGGTSTGFGFAPLSRRGASERKGQQQQQRAQKTGYDPNRRPPASVDYRPSGGASISSAGSSHGQTHSRVSHTFRDAIHEESQSQYYYATGPSGGLPHVDFSVVHVPDELRDYCADCDAEFSITIRRHHCRLCGDIFCISCSGKKCLLPMDGPEYEKPVRVCNLCHEDVEGRGNYFTLRRYLTALVLYDPNKDRPGTGSTGDEEAITAEIVAAALSSLAQDLDSIVRDERGATVAFEEKVSVQSETLVAAICRHLSNDGTADRAVRALSSLLALGNVLGDEDFAKAVYFQDTIEEKGKEARPALDAVLTLLEWSGTSRRTLAVQEQAARAIFYLSDPSVVSSQDSPGGGGSSDRLDVHRALRDVLDHATTSASPSLQRWAAAGVRNLIIEDKRRALIAVEESAATGESPDYESLVAGRDFVDNGGAMILCSLMGSDDGDTRAHGAAAITSAITSAREMAVAASFAAAATGAMSESAASGDAALVRTIATGGGCGPSLADMLVSSDDATAGMGCELASALVSSVVLHPGGREIGGVDGGRDDDNLSAYREAALAIAGNDGCLPALLGLLRDERGNVSTRPVELRRCAMEVLAAVCISASAMGGEILRRKAQALNKAERTGLEMDEEDYMSDVQDNVKEAVANLEDEGAAETAYATLLSTSSQSLVGDRETSFTLLREAAAMVLGGMTGCSLSAIAFLRRERAVGKLLRAAGEGGMLHPGKERWGPRNLGLMEATAALLKEAWEDAAAASRASKSVREIEGQDSELRLGRPDPMVHSNMIRDSFNSDEENPTPLDVLLESIDASLIPLVSRLINSKIEYHDRPRAYGTIRSKIVCCDLLSAAFGIARCDGTKIGYERLYEAADHDAEIGGGGRSRWTEAPPGAAGDMVSCTVSLLQSAAIHAQTNRGRSHGEVELPLGELVEKCLLAAGSMCGAGTPCPEKGGEKDPTLTSVSKQYVPFELYIIGEPKYQYHSYFFNPEW